MGGVTPYLTGCMINSKVIDWWAGNVPLCQHNSSLHIDAQHAYKNMVEPVNLPLVLLSHYIGPN